MNEERFRELSHALRTPLAVLLHACHRVEDPELAAMMRRNVETMVRLLDEADARDET